MQLDAEQLLTALATKIGALDDETAAGMLVDLLRSKQPAQDANTDARTAVKKASQQGWINCSEQHFAGGCRETKQGSRSEG